MYRAETKPVSSLAVLLSKALDGIHSSLRGRQTVG